MTFECADGSTPVNWHVSDYMYEGDTKAQAYYSGRGTVTVLWYTQTNTIVSNESADIIRMFNSAFDEVGAVTGDYYPEAQRDEIEEINARIYDTVNNGVYKSGFSTTQDAYEEAVVPLFETLDWLEERLSKQRYLMGAHQTEADWRLWTTLVRFDPVYVGHFKCNLRTIAEYPNLSNYVRDLYQTPSVPETVDISYTKKHYYGSHDTVNPTRIVPLGPNPNRAAAHDRGRFEKAA